MIMYYLPVHKRKYTESFINYSVLIHKFIMKAATSVAKLIKLRGK